jgi:single-stranded-DNA-specific exonuclease
VKLIQQRDVPDSLQARLPAYLHPVLRRIYAGRQVRRAEDLDNTLACLLPPATLKDIDAACALLETALREDQRILVVGDFDADGATSSALMVSGLRAMGAARVDYLVPNRFQFGYGLTPEIVAVAADFAPDLLITVDNGISSIAGVAAAKRRGMRVLVTDHHLPGSELPQADAIVNPNQHGDAFPSKCLAGVGVAFYLLMALRGRLRDSGWFEARALGEPNLGDYLDLVALGTVADLVPLDHNNRVLVQQGMQRVRAGRCRAGIRALLEVAGRNPGRLVAADFGFSVGPRLNAAGRLDDMSLGIECLLCTDAVRARELAAQLDALNRERREIERDMKNQAIEYVQDMHLDTRKLPLGLCLYDASWHQGVIGIVASRIKEQFHRPVIAFANAGEGELKGSARSIPGLHIRDTLDAIAARYPQLLQKFGGHAMAAGLSLAEHCLDGFRQAFEQELQTRIDAGALQGVIHSDGELQGDDFSLELSELLRAAGPWGQEFPEPLFDGVFTVLRQRVVGDGHLKLSVRSELGGRQLDAIAFHQADSGSLCEGQQVRMAYRLDSNEYRGLLGLQLVVEFIQPLDPVGC